MPKRLDANQNLVIIKEHSHSKIRCTSRDKNAEQLPWLSLLALDFYFHALGKDYGQKLSETTLRVLDTYPEGTSSLAFRWFPKNLIPSNFRNNSLQLEFGLDYAMKSQFFSMLPFSLRRVILVFESYCVISLPYGAVRCTISSQINNFRE